MAKKPGLLLVEREGDPAGGLAFAATSTAGSAGILGLARVLRTRIKAVAAVECDISPNAFGLTVTMLIDSQERAGSALRAIDLALSQPVEKQLDPNFIEGLRASMPIISNVSAGERSLANCSGEILFDGLRNDRVDRNKLRDSIEQARLEVRSLNNARFAIVGTAAIAHEVEQALHGLPSWPEFDQHQADESRRKTNAPPFTTSASTFRRLSFAWRVKSGAIAELAALSMKQRGSPLLAQVSALDDDWRVENISSVARDVGGCLRVDLGYGSDTNALPSESLKALIRVVTGESRRALDTSRDDTPFQLVGSDPRAAARRLAWYSLSKDDDTAHDRLQIHLKTLPGDLPAARFETLMREAVSDRTDAPLESTSREEVGQPELWAVLASPCGTALEFSSESGGSAAWIESLARRFSSHGGVQLEPYISEDGLGLIAHTGPRYSNESSGSMASRLGDVIGSVVATGSISGAELASVREDFLLRIGASPRRAWWQLVDVLSSGHAATFEPLGTFESLRNLDLNTIRARRAHWIKGPLRVAALLNRGRDQANDIRSSLLRWLNPHRLSIQQCPNTLTPARSSQEIQISAKSPDIRDANAYIAIQLAPQLEHAFEYEHWLHWLLGRPGGWLDSSLVRSGSIRAFTADIRGPRYNRALIISLNSDDETRISEAVARVRELFARLAKQGPESRDLELAQAWSEEQLRWAELDPRRRLVDQWRGNSAPLKTSKSGFSKYVMQALASAPVTIVRVHRQTS